MMSHVNELLEMAEWLKSAGEPDLARECLRLSRHRAGDRLVHGLRRRVDVGKFANRAWVMSQQLGYLLVRTRRGAFYYPEPVGYEERGDNESCHPER